jgi:hypothetical protein
MDVIGLTVRDSISVISQRLLLSETSRLPVGPAQPSLQFVLEAFAREQNVWGVKLIAHFYLVPSVRMSGDGPQLHGKVCRCVGIVLCPLVITVGHVLLSWWFRSKKPKSKAFSVVLSSFAVHRHIEKPRFAE